MNVRVLWDKLNPGPTDLNITEGFNEEKFTAALTLFDFIQNNC